MKRRILIRRDVGGAGDILMHRPLFKGVKERYPGYEIVFAVPERYIPLVRDHPYIDRVISTEESKGGRYERTFNTLGKAAAYEFSKVPFVDKHRAELWAVYLRTQLTEYDGHMNFTRDEVKFAQKFFAPYKGMKVGFAPVSAHPSKNIEREKVQEVINRLSNQGCHCFIFHNEPLGYKSYGKGIDVNVGIREWMVLAEGMDVIVTVATSMFHVANLLHIPTVAIFGVEDLAVFGKFFPEMIPLQRTRKDPDWPFCPCWNWADCKLRPRGDRGHFPLPCLNSITATEIYKSVMVLLNVHS